MENADNTVKIPLGKRLSKGYRAKPTSPFSPATLRGSRKTVRRNKDRNAHDYVDLYGPDEFLIILLVLILSVVDAFLTLELVDSGMTEMNSVMDYYLRLGPLPFVLIKYLLTAVGLVILLTHKNYTIFHGWISVKAIMVVLAIMYCALVTYELGLFHESSDYSTLAFSMTTGLTGTF